MKLEKYITTIKNYPDTGEHMQCDLYLDGIIFPFEIRKGEDMYYYTDKNGKEALYNNLKTKVDQRWIVNLRKASANESLCNIFEIEVNKSLDKIIDYCIKLYKKSLIMEQERIAKEIELMNSIDKE